MQGSFEKKVQEKLEALQLNPSAPVWDKIEAQIKPRKKRRAFLWLPFIIALLTTAGWWIWQQPHRKDGLTGIMENRQTGPADGKPGNTLTGKNGPGVSPVMTPANKTAEKRLLLTTEIQRLQQGKKEDFLLRRPAPSAKEKENQPGIVQNGQNAEKTITELLAEKIPDLAKQQQSREMPEGDVMPVDSFTQSIQPAAENDPAVKLTDAAAAKPSFRAISKNWKWQLVVQGGWSSSSTSEPMAVNYDRYVASPQNSGGNYGGGTVHSPNGVNGGGAFAFGAAVSKTLSQRFQFSTGLQYGYYTSHTQTGSFKPVDTTLAYGIDMVKVDGFYQNGSQQNYTNRYHVLEVPVSLDYQVIGSVPLYLSAGASYGYLLKSNALTYDWMANMYYYNEKNLSRHQLSVFASLPYGIVSKKKVGIRLGPMVQYQLTSFQKETGTAVPRQFVAGVKTVVQF